MVQFMSNGFDWSWVFALFSFQKEIVSRDGVSFRTNLSVFFLNLSKLTLVLNNK